jgi:hypothetical protein
MPLASLPAAETINRYFLYVARLDRVKSRCIGGLADLSDLPGCAATLTEPAGRLNESEVGHPSENLQVVPGQARSDYVCLRWYLCYSLSLLE